MSTSPPPSSSSPRTSINLLLISIPIIIIFILFNFQQQPQSSSSSSSLLQVDVDKLQIVEASSLTSKIQTETKTTPSNQENTTSSSIVHDDDDELYFSTFDQYESYRKEELSRFEEILSWKNFTPESDQELLHLINPPPPPLPPSQSTIVSGSSNERKHKKKEKKRYFKNLPIFPCPFFRHKIGKDADSKTSADAIRKYSRYTQQFCNTSGMLQMFFGLRRYLSFLDVMAKIVNLKEGDRVFDLGSGCGTMLNYFHLKFRTTGLGVDITSDAVVHAKAHARENQTFCHLDATLLRAFPSDSFDVVVSWAVLYHLRRTWVQCAVMKELTRMLKPGGVALIAQIRTEKTQAFWKKGKCKIDGASWRRLSDASIFREKSFKRNGFFSIYLTKDENNTSSAAVAATATRKKLADDIVLKEDAEE